ncbi:MAG: ATP-binding protein [Actinomycetota bacterium]|nr:MAG: ATP-binding protein [Actinomycetota bacterium]
MALSNRDRIDRGLQALVLGVRPFVDQHMGAAAKGADWVALLTARDAAKHGTVKKNSPDDPRFLLKILTEEWRAFGQELSRVDQSYASELRDVGNRLAHGESFSADDTTRALDTIERLLTSVGAPDQADAVRTLRLDHQRDVFEAQTKKTVRAAVGTVNTPGTGLKPWREVITPHPDVTAGQFNAAEFAADLHQVSTGETTQQEYADPREFFARTYLTEGLKDLLGRAVQRLSGDLNASPVVNLQTNFGGGKTHSMLAVYHLVAGLPASAYPQPVQEIVGPVKLDELNVRRVTLVGTHLAPNQPRVKEDGTAVRTLWGELAWQLGGRTAYDVVADADRSGTPPGDALTGLLREHAPVLILIDEWVAYARGLSDDEDLAGGRFDNQFTFAQHLTEAVSAIPGAMLLVSIPASDTLDAGGGGSAIEVGGERGRRALMALQNVVGRKADHWRPASSIESFEIVRRRLFAEPDAAARTEIAAVARQVVQFYREHHGQFPREAEESAYEDRLKAAYPIHPELFDRLYHDWSTLERFQRTRGVLRLMSIVIHELWRSGDASPLITPGTIPLHAPLVASELTNYLPDAWRPIIDSDIDGEGSDAVRIDASRPGTFGARSLTRRIARTIFLDTAATLNSDHRGVERPRIWLGVAIPGDTLGNFGSALELLSQESTYLYSEAARYWFSTAASVTRTAADIADRLREEPEAVWKEILDRVKVLVRDRGGFAGVHVGPVSSADVPDLEEVRLVVVHPRMRHAKNEKESEALRFARDATLRVGSAQRRNRNMVVFVAADGQRYEELDSAVRAFLSWKQIADQATEMDLTPSQKAQADSRRRQADEDARNRLAATYTWTFVPTQDPQSPPEVAVVPVKDGQGGLAERVTTKLVREGLLATTYGAFSARMALDGPLSTAWAAGHVSVGELWSLYTQYPYLDRLRDRSVLESALLSPPILWEQEGFAWAASVDDGGRYVGLVLPSDETVPSSLPDSWLVVKPGRALRQRAADKAAADNTVADPIGLSGSDDTADGLEVAGLSAAAEAEPGRSLSVSRFFGSVGVDPERYNRDFARVGQEILQHLAAVPGVELTVTIEIHATATEGFSPETVRVVGENATTLKFKASGFDD